ncbi:MAG TPA: L-lactate permease [Ktedonosporobacter sp.]|jgi:lactate permease|nr:L-lactate permease [Ktedonosporobacter sp.]
MINIVLATTPLIVAIILLVALQQSGLRAGLATLAATIILTLLAPSFHLSPPAIVLAAARGAGTSLTVLYVLFPALLLYQIQNITDSITVLAQGVTRLCPDRDTQILLLVLGLAPFIEAVSGFGVGTVVVIPMLMALGLDTLQAATLGLLGQLAVPWGGLAVGITLGAELTGLHSGVIGSYTALITAPLPIGFGIATLATYGGKGAVKRLWPAVVAASIVLVAGEWFFSQMPGVELAGAFAGVPTTILLALWGHFAARRANGKNDPAHTTAQATQEQAGDISSPRFLLALAPYIILIGALLITRLIVPLQQWLQNHVLLVIPAIDLHFQLLYNPGFYVLLAALAAALLLNAGVSGSRIALGKTARQFTPGAIAIVSFLAASQVMSANGMIAVLGAAAATLGRNYSWIAPWLGALGGWLTGSSAGSNAVFAQLQYETSLRASLPVNWIMASQCGAASNVTMVSPARVVLATSTTGIVGKEGLLVRKLGPLVLGAVLIIMILTGIVAFYV